MDRADGTDLSTESRAVRRRHERHRRERLHPGAGAGQAANRQTANGLRLPRADLLGGDYHLRGSESGACRLVHLAMEGSGVSGTEASAAVSTDTPAFGITIVNRPARAARRTLKT